MLFEIAKRVSRVLRHLISRALRIAIGDRVEDPAMHGARVHEALRGVLARCELAVDDPLTCVPRVISVSPSARTYPSAETIAPR